MHQLGLVRDGAHLALAFLPTLEEEAKLPAHVREQGEFIRRDPTGSAAVSVYTTSGFGKNLATFPLTVVKQTPQC